MNDINVLKFTDAGLNEIHKLLLEAPTKIGMPLIQDIDAQLRAAAKEADEQSTKKIAEHEEQIRFLEAQIEHLSQDKTS